MAIDSRYSADTVSVDAIITAVYATISGPAGPRDEIRERHLYHPDARLMRGLPTGSPPADPPTPGLRVFTVDQFLEFCLPALRDRAFYELEIGREVFQFGRWVHAISAYESRYGLDQRPYARGINGIQLWWDADRWWIVNMIWDWETPSLLIPSHLSRPPRYPSIGPAPDG